MLKVWEWLKTHWKWLILPLWVASILLVWVFHGGSKPLFPVTGTKDKDADNALEEQRRASEEFKARMEELSKIAEERLKTASEEQVKAYQEIKDKTPEEVAKWIDSLS